MALIRQWYKKLEGHYLHPKSNGPRINEKLNNGAVTNGKVVNGKVSQGRHPPNEIENTIARLTTASSDLNAFLRERKPQAPSIPGTLDVPLTEDYASFHESKANLINLAEKLISLVKGPRDVVIAISFQVSSYNLFRLLHVI